MLYGHYVLLRLPGDATRWVAPALLSTVHDHTTMATWAGIHAGLPEIGRLRSHRRHKSTTATVDDALSMALTALPGLVLGPRPLLAA